MLAADSRARVLGFVRYSAVGAVVALGYGIVALRTEHDMHVGAWLAVVSVGGGLAGAVLYLTRSWHFRSRALAIARWAIAGLVAGGTGGLLLIATGNTGPVGALVGAAAGCIALLCCGLYWHQDVLLTSDAPRSPIHLARTWLIVFTVALALGLLAWLA